MSRTTERIVAETVRSVYEASLLNGKTRAILPLGMERALRQQGRFDREVMARLNVGLVAHDTTSPLEIVQLDQRGEQ